MRTSVLLLMAILMGCSHSNPPECNTITFTDGVDAVADSIDVVVSVMDSLWTRERVRGYRISGDGHTIEWWNGAFEWVEGPLNDAMPELRSLPWATRRRFLAAIRFLKHNVLNPCILANDCYRWEFTYRDRSVLMYDDNRYIVSGATEEDVRMYKKIRTVLERKGRLLLVAPARALIR